MKISVVVPVYNVAEYLPECIESIQKQTFDDYEIILVDDGSTDSSGIICDEYAANDARIRIIHQKNAGVSAARNTGLESAVGDYIAFVDSDDIVDTEYLSCMYEGITAQNADMVVVQHKSFKQSIGESKPNTQSKNSLLVSGREACFIRYAGYDKVYPAVWGKLYNREIFNDLRFPLGRIHEDQYVISVALQKCRKILILDTELYYYRTRENSITNSAFSANQFDNIILMNEVIAYYKLTGDTKLVNAAKKHRRKTLAQYTIQARAAHIKNPDGCRLNLLRAFVIARKVRGKDWCEWNLSMIYPKLVPWYERLEWLLKQICPSLKG